MIVKLSTLARRFGRTAEAEAVKAKRTARALASCEAEINAESVCKVSSAPVTVLPTATLDWRAESGTDNPPTIKRTDTVDPKDRRSAPVTSWPNAGPVARYVLNGHPDTKATVRTVYRDLDALARGIKAGDARDAREATWCKVRGREAGADSTDHAHTGDARDCPHCAAQAEARARHLVNRAAGLTLRTPEPRVIVQGSGKNRRTARKDPTLHTVKVGDARATAYVEPRAVLGPAGAFGTRYARPRLILGRTAAQDRLVVSNASARRQWSALLADHGDGADQVAAWARGSATRYPRPDATARALTPVIRCALCKRSDCDHVFNPDTDRLIVEHSSATVGNWDQEFGRDAADYLRAEARKAKHATRRARQSARKASDGTQPR